MPKIFVGVLLEIFPYELATILHHFNKSKIPFNQFLNSLILEHWIGHRFHHSPADVVKFYYIYYSMQQYYFCMTFHVKPWNYCFDSNRRHWQLSPDNLIRNINKEKDKHQNNHTHANTNAYKHERTYTDISKRDRINY